MAAGRHRAFDKDVALENAMIVFWKNGYANTSLIDLTQAMGIGKPSLYAAFGNKEQLFIAALEQYSQQQIQSTFGALVAPNQPLEQRLRAYFKSVLRLFYQPNAPVGCLIANSTGEFAGDGMPETAQQFLSNLNQVTQQQLTDFFAQEHAKGTLKSTSSPPTLALYLMAINGGLTMLVRDGTPLAELEAMIEHVVLTIC